MSSIVLGGVATVLYILGAYQTYQLLPAIDEAAASEGRELSELMQVVIVLGWPVFMLLDVFLGDHNDE